MRKSRKLMLLVYFIFPISIIFSTAFGEWHGTYENDIGGKAMSMGGAFTSIAEGPSAIYWNPAGIRGKEKFKILACYKKTWGCSKLFLPIEDSTECVYNTSRNLPTFLGGVYNFSKFSIGLAYNMPYEDYMKIEDIPATGPGVEEEFWNSIRLARIHSVELSLATNVQKVFLGLTGAYIFKDIKYILDWQGETEDSEYDYYEGRGFKIGSGVKYIASKNLSLGAAIKLGYLKNDSTSLSYNLNDWETIPLFLSFGIAITPMSKITFLYDINFTEWGEVKYKDSYGERTSDWKNVIKYRMGTKFIPTNNLSLGFGLYTDPSPSHYEWDQLSLTTGIEYKYKHFCINIALSGGKARLKEQINCYLSLSYQG